MLVIDESNAAFDVPSVEKFLQTFNVVETCERIQRGRTLLMNFNRHQYRPCRVTVSVVCLVASHDVIYRSRIMNSCRT